MEMSGEFESNTECTVTKSVSPSEQPSQSNHPTPWLRRARIISAIIYVALQTIYFTVIVIYIALSSRCEKAPTTTCAWWMNSVFLRFTNSSGMEFTGLTGKLADYKSRYNMQAVWLRPIIPLSHSLNPMDFNSINMKFGRRTDLNDLLKEAKEKDIRVIVDIPINHVSLQSRYATSRDDSYFVWNSDGDTSNWMTIDDNQQSAWTYDDRKKSYYLHQFNNNKDSIDINYRNNRVLDDMVDTITYWNRNFEFGGFNLPGLSYAYEDYEYNNETSGSRSRTRHLEEDYMLLARFRSEIDKDKIILLDSIDTLDTPNEQLLSRYYGDKQNDFGGVQLASLNSFILDNETEANVTLLFEKYYKSIFFRNNQSIIWSSLSLNPNLNEAFFSACLCHKGVISIDVERQGEQLSNAQIGRLQRLITLVRDLDVFRLGEVHPSILPNSNWLTITRSRAGSKHHMIIINFNNFSGNHKIKLPNEAINEAEVVLANIAKSASKYKADALISLSDPIELEPYEYLIIRWKPSA